MIKQLSYIVALSLTSLIGCEKEHKIIFNTDEITPIYPWAKDTLELISSNGDTLHFCNHGNIFGTFAYEPLKKYVISKAIDNNNKKITHARIKDIYIHTNEHFLPADTIAYLINEDNNKIYLCNFSTIKTKKSKEGYQK